MVDVLAGLLEVLAPTRCAGCDLPGDILCHGCREGLPRIDRAWACPRCGAPFGYLVCTECWQSVLAFSATMCVGTLSEPLSRCVSLYKDAGERRLGTLLGDLLAEEVAQWTGWADAVVPVPASSRSVRLRGFDHVRRLAEPVARATGVPLLYVLEVGRTRDQRHLGRLERSRNVSQAFSVVPGHRIPRRILLIDDVMTTGATADAAAAVLLAAGADEIRVGTVARAW